MGAQVFTRSARGASADLAFTTARLKARSYYGMRSYTGSIAEKDSFVMIELPADRELEEFVNDMIDSDDGRISDKWGPAGCIDEGNGSYIFFGWASC